MDLLNTINPKIDFKNKYIQHFSLCENVNFINIEDICVPSNVRKSFNNVIKTRIKVFADPNESLPFNTKIIATIRTTDSEPVYLKLYPDFVNKEIKDLQENNIIRPSR